MGDDVSTMFANNIVVGNVTVSAGFGGTAQITPTYKDNIRFMGTGPADGFTITDPKLAKLPATGDAQVITPGSPAIGAATTAFPFVTDDIRGTPRTAKSDIGAVQLSTSPGPRRPLTVADVGPEAP
jgi:poly(beta-D-mannuronate) lyase